MSTWFRGRSPCQSTRSRHTAELQREPAGHIIAEVNRIPETRARRFVLLCQPNSAQAVEEHRLVDSRIAEIEIERRLELRRAPIGIGCYVAKCVSAARCPPEVWVGVAGGSGRAVRIGSGQRHAAPAIVRILRSQSASGNAGRKGAIARSARIAIRGLCAFRVGRCSKRPASIVGILLSQRRTRGDISFDAQHVAIGVVA